MRYITREDSVIGAVDVETVLATCGSDTAPGTAIVPGDVHKLKQLIVALGDSANTGADGHAVILVRLSGSALKEGDQIFAIGYGVDAFTAGGTTAFGHQPAKLFNVDIDVNPNMPISVYAVECGGTDIGTPEVGVTMGFA